MKWARKPEHNYFLRSENQCIQTVPEKPMKKCLGFTYTGSKLFNPILHGLFSIPYYMGGGVWYTPPVDYCSLLIGGRPKWTNFSWHHYFKHLKGPGHVIFWKFFKNFKNFGRQMILVKIWQKEWKESKCPGSKVLHSLPCSTAAAVM